MNDKVKNHHLKRLACLYIRQSSPQQLVENVESKHRQYALKERAITLGWKNEQVQIIDSELGKSAAGFGDREGFQQLTTPLM
jgi:DNA invertase Pin-like site-specific DNA recombinase